MSSCKTSINIVMHKGSLSYWILRNGYKLTSAWCKIVGNVQWQNYTIVGNGKNPIASLASHARGWLARVIGSSSS